MANPIGITFAPTPEQAQAGQKNARAIGGMPEAIQFLSLRLPKVLGSRPLAPEQLLTAKPTNPGSAVVQSVLRSIGMDAPIAPAEPVRSEPTVNPTTPWRAPASSESSDLASAVRQQVSTPPMPPMPSVLREPDPLPPALSSPIVPWQPQVEAPRALDAPAVHPSNPMASLAQLLQHAVSAPQPFAPRSRPIAPPVYAPPVRVTAGGDALPEPPVGGGMGTAVHSHRRGKLPHER